MIFVSLAGEGCRDREGIFVPVPQCRRRKRLMGGVANLAQLPEGAPVAPDAGSYQQIWDVLWDTCNAMASPDACTRLLGYTPFVCPVDKPKSILIPVLIGVVIGKLIL